MQTRRHPRTLNEAFPRGAEYACAVERPEPMRRVMRRTLGLIAALLGVALAARLLFSIF